MPPKKADRLQKESRRLQNGSRQKQCLPIFRVRTRRTRPFFYVLAPGAYGILEPETVVPVAPERLDLVLVPGVAFDKNGGRIGFGKGYYDRFLQKTSAKTVALCYGFQIVPDCFSESEDYPMDYIVTEDEVIACGKGHQ